MLVCSLFSIFHIKYSEILTMINIFIFYSPLFNQIKFQIFLSPGLSNYLFFIMLKLLLFSILFVRSFESSCLPFLDGGLRYPRQDFQVGANSLSNDKPSKDRQSVFKFGLRNKYDLSNCKAGAVISFFQNFEDQEFLDFQINAIMESASSIYFLLFRRRMATWTTTYVHYIITSRDDIRIQSINYNADKLVGPNPGLIEISYSYYFGYDRPWKSRQGQVKSFISGIKYHGSSLDIKIKSQKLIAQKSMIQFLIVINNQKFPLQKVRITYVAFTMDNTPIRFKQISFNQLSFISKQQMRTKGKTTYNRIQADSAFLGITKINLEGFVKFRNLTGMRGKERLLINIFTSEFIQFVDIFNVEGFEFQLNPDYTQVSHVLLKNFPVINNQICINFGECIANEKATLTYKDKNSYCISCTPNALYSYKTSKCECLKGFYFDKNSNCLSLESLCNSNQTYHKGDCYERVPDQPKCDQNQSFNEQKNICQCMNGFSLNNSNKCTPCHQQSVYNQKDQRCKCRAKYFGDGFRCIPKVISNVFNLKEFLKEANHD